MDIQIGKVIHYYDKIDVAVVQVLSQSLKVGDSIKISGHDNEFKQKVTSLQVEHTHVDSIAAGGEGAMKTDQAVKEGDMVYLLGK